MVDALDIVASGRTDFLTRPTSVSEAVQLFQLAGSTGGKRPATLRFYAYTLGSLIRFIGDIPCQEIRLDHLRAYLEDLRERRRVAPATLSCHVRALRAFFNWAVCDGVTKANPALSLQRPRLPKLFPYTMTASQVQALLQTCDLHTIGGCRAYTLVLLIYGTGVRLSEALALRVEDVDFGSQQILVREGKGGKPRFIPLDPSLSAVLGRHLRHRGVDSAWILCTHDGRALKVRRAHAILQRLGKKAGLTGVRVSAHTLRHAFATAFLERGGNLEALRRLLGHSTLVITQAYLHLSTSGLRDAMERYSPLKGLGISLAVRKPEG